MPFQPINFANIPVQERPEGPDLLNSLMNFYKVSNAPGHFQRQGEQENLANALSQLKLKQAPEEFQMKKDAAPFANALKEQQAEALKRKGSGPFSMFENLPSGDIGQVEGLELLRSLAQVDPKKYGHRYQTAQKSFDANLAKKESVTNRNNVLNSTTNYRLMTPDAKKQTEAYLRGMGINPTEGIKMLSGGQSLSDISKSLGINLDDVQPSYAPTSSVITDEQKRVANTAELNTISKLISPELAKVAQKIGKTSPALYGKMLGNYFGETKESPEEIGKILAAHALQFEQSAGRLRTLGARVGIEGIREVTEKMLSDMNVPRSLLTPKIIESMNKWSDEWISQGVDSYSNAILGRSKLGKKSTKESGFKNEEGIIDLSKYGMKK